MCSINRTIVLPNTFSSNNIDAVPFKFLKWSQVACQLPPCSSICSHIVSHCNLIFYCFEGDLRRSFPRTALQSIFWVAILQLLGMWFLPFSVQLTSHLQNEMYCMTLNVWRFLRDGPRSAFFPRQWTHAVCAHGLVWSDDKIQPCFSIPSKAILSFIRRNCVEQYPFRIPNEVHLQSYQTLWGCVQRMWPKMETIVVCCITRETDITIWSPFQSTCIKIARMERFSRIELSQFSVWTREPPHRRQPGPVLVIVQRKWSVSGIMNYTIAYHRGQWDSSQGQRLTNNHRTGKNQHHDSPQNTKPCDKSYQYK